MSGYNENFEFARENFALYWGTLANVIQKLKARERVDEEELNAYQEEQKRIESELRAMRAENTELIHKANFIYTRTAKNLIDSYLQ